MTHFKTSYLSIPIHVLGIVFIIALILTLGILSWYTSQKMSMLERQSVLKTNVLAKDELQKSLSQLFESTKTLAHTFANWDETRQQINNPTYYKYWQINRVPNMSFTPGYFDSIQLYDKKGIPLSESLAINMPLTVNQQKLEAFIVMDVDHPHLYQQANIIIKNKTAFGFLVIKIDLTQALSNSHFKYLNIHKLKFESVVNQPIKVNNVINYFRISAVVNSEFVILERLFNNTMINISVASLVLFLIFLVFFIRYLAYPLRDLSQQIDLIGNGKKTIFDLQHDKNIRITEFEKVYQSLNQYHTQLSASENELRESELQSRTVLETVPDAIITLDNQFKIIASNNATETLFGYSDKYLNNKNIDFLFSKDSNNKFHQAIENFSFSSNHYQNEYEQQFIGRHKSGNTIHIQCSLTSIILAGENSYLFIAKDITKRKQYESQLTHLANFDSLTGLSNRTLFHDRLEHALRQAKRNNNRLALLYIDLDRFKPINDTYGHKVGDLLLNTVAKRIMENVQEGDSVSRLSGDEFTIILEDVDHEEDTAIIAKNILKTLSKSIHIHGTEFFITASIGITTYPEDAKTSSKLLKNANTAVYRAKELGGDKYQYFTMDLNYRAEERLTLEKTLRQALDKNLFTLHYQPKINIRDNSISGIEALMRLNDPQLGVIPPVSFIPLLEDTGLIHRAGEWVIREACSQYKVWQKNGFPELRMSINLSAYQFKEKDLVDTIFNIIEATKINPKNLEFEITESLLVDNIEETTKALLRLHNYGIKISIDDFGTGYSSLAYLKKFPIDILKIDRSFVKDISTDENNSIIVDTIIAMARSLKLEITAEGVENEKQLKFLADRNCDEIQGYLFSKPLTADQLIDFIDGESWKTINKKNNIKALTDK